MLVSFGGLFEDYIFAMVRYLSYVVHPSNDACCQASKLFEQMLQALVNP
jgi:hypothetical protein